MSVAIVLCVIGTLAVIAVLRSLRVPTEQPIVLVPERDFDRLHEAYLTFRAIAAEQAVNPTKPSWFIRWCDSKAQEALAEITLFSRNERAL